MLLPDHVNRVECAKVERIGSHRWRCGSWSEIGVVRMARHAVDIAQAFNLCPEVG